ncbi:MAG: hypothetical protein LQ342_003957 [Letrouitia transgressa]|nr:MAG: hypothetical protein LQ342_003957 [Letrouitia transgressa]
MISFRPLSHFASRQNPRQIFSTIPICDFKKLGLSPGRGFSTVIQQCWSDVVFKNDQQIGHKQPALSLRGTFANTQQYRPGLYFKIGPNIGFKEPASSLRRGFVTVIPQYNEGLLFRCGRHVGRKEPSLRLSIPIFNEVRKVDLRTATMQIPSQELITKDNITIQVDAVAFIEATDPLKVICNVENCETAVSEAAQTSLRDQLSRASFSEVLNNREEAGKSVLEALCAMTADWGVVVKAVKLKNIKIDRSMIRAMARQAEAERLKLSRLIEASAEYEALHTLVEAAKKFEGAPIGLRLRELQTYLQVAAEKNMVMVIDGNVDTGVARGLNHLSRSPYVRNLNNPAAENGREVQSKQTDKGSGSSLNTKTSNKDTGKEGKDKSHRNDADSNEKISAQSKNTIA